MVAHSQDNIKGLMLALITAIMWGLLPLVLRTVLELMDAYTITWYRFLFAAILVGFSLKHKNKIPALFTVDKSWLKPLTIAAVFLSFNYILYLSSLYFVPAETAQMLIQMAPLMMLLGSVIFLKEAFSRGQMVGSFVLITGLVMFFNQQFSQSAALAREDFLMGFVIMLGASLTWAVYAIMQKQMLKKFSSTQIMWVIYVLSSFFFLPVSSPMQIASFDWIALMLLLFCCANTLIAYGSFAKSLEFWPASKVSAVLAITPLLTVLFATIAEQLFPQHVTAQSLNTLAYIGAVLVVSGSILTALGNKILSRDRVTQVKNRLLRKG
ncbi:DMT family transporter [Thalassotalea mangrovi]|uniref:DMT family transporter n=1 Tax=Thalassotalea mangrovi TaxID=2572245 RepID=A0A4U1B8U8_9GAMM|nr:DMT family transporter [Thalassotalea mangrovi]TKB46948.1 DMT family transporter [Thalassotalea mangrovi]